MTLNWMHATTALLVASVVSSARGDGSLEIRAPRIHASLDQPVTVEAAGPGSLAGKTASLGKGEQRVGEGRFESDGERAVAKIRFDPLPWGILPDRLQVSVDGKQAAEFTAPLVFIGMRGSPPAEEVVAALDSPCGLLPLVDQFGQYRHRDWPGKTRSRDDLAARRQEETADLRQHPSPADWNRYGGWQAGPQLEATGRFRVAKHEDKWWLVDPEGRLFWSHGSDCVRSSTGSTPLTDRRHYFQDLPAAGSPEAEFYGQAGWAPKGYYERFQGRSYHTFNFTGVNLRRKYGAGWRQESAALAHARLRSWGMNTIGNWSEPEIYALRKTPYVVNSSPSGARVRPIEGSTGYWGKFPDVFDPGFRAALRGSLEAERAQTAEDPMCIGYFVHNELGWGDETSLAVAALASPADQPAKVAFVDDLKAKYQSVDRLNAAWGTQHASWEALLACPTPPDKKQAHEDLTAFYSRLAETYFRTCREEVKRVAPHRLYLGCRFAWVNDRAARAAADYCDVIAYNLYRRDISKFRLPDGIDKPVIVGEFHFGALDRGLFHPGLQKTGNQSERAAAYKSYVQGALRNPVIVGTHWFQFGDQATTGRGDGENYQIGFLDICDTPYPETIAACREVGYSLYGVRLRAE